MICSSSRINTSSAACRRFQRCVAGHRDHQRTKQSAPVTLFSTTNHAAKEEYRNETTTISPKVPYGPFGSGGTVVGYSKYDGIRHAFEDNFAERLELGAQLVIYHEGEQIVDLYGYAPEQEGYNGDTLQCVYSSGKNMESIAMAILVDRGLVCYDDLVTKYWPEFGIANGKENVTVADVMRHDGGVPFLVDPSSDNNSSTIVLTPEDVANIDSLEAKICAAPKHPFLNVKHKNGRMYHAITRGWLINGILRRADPSGRTLGVFIKEEISDKFGLTFFCGIPKDEQGKYDYAAMTKSNLLYDIFFQLGPSAFGYGEQELWRLIKVSMQSEDGLGKRQVASWMKTPPEPTFNDTSLGRSLEISSAGMFANARSMAKINAAMAGDGSLDGVRVLSTDVVRESMSDVKVAVDMSLSLPSAGIETAYGFSKGGFGDFKTFFAGNHTDRKILHPDDKEAYGNMKGWGGWGGSMSLWDREKNLAFSYVPNAMTLNLLGSTRSRKILLELQNCV